MSGRNTPTNYLNGVTRTNMLAPDDSGLCNDAEALLFEWAYTGVLPREHVLYLVPHGRSVIVSTKALGHQTLGTKEAKVLRGLLLEAGDEMHDGKWICLEPLWKARIIWNQKFGWGLDTGQGQQWRVSK